MNFKIRIEETVSANGLERRLDLKQLHELFEIETPLLQWFNVYVQEYGLIDGEDFIILLDTTGDQELHVMVKLSICAHICLLQSTEQGHEAFKTLMVASDRRRKGLMRRGQRLLYGYVSTLQSSVMYPVSVH